MQLNKDFLVIFIGKLIQVAIVIATIKISTMLLSPKEMGNIYLFLTVQTFFVLTFISPIGQYINRKTHTWEIEKSILDNLSILVIYTLFISLFSVFFGYIIYSNFNICNSFEIYTFLILLFSFIFIITLNQTYIPMLNMLHYRIDFTVLTILTSFFILIFGYLAIYIYAPKAEYWLYGILLSNMVFTVYGYILIKKRTTNSFSGFKILFQKLKYYDYKTLLLVVIPICIATLFMWLQNSGYRILIEQNIGLEFLGFLGVGLAVSGQIASVFESILTQYLSPIYYQRISIQDDIQHRTESFNWLINIKLPMYFLLAMFITFFAEYIVVLLVDEKYKEVYVYTIFGIWIEFFRMMTNVLYSVSLSELKTRKIMFPYLVGSLVTIVLVYMSSLDSDYELYLPIALVIGGFITMVVMYFSMQKLIDFKIDFRLIFISFLISLPYFATYFFNFETNFVSNLLVVGCFGLYFLGTLYFIYKKGLSYDNC